MPAHKATAAQLRRLLVPLAVALLATAPLAATSTAAAAPIPAAAVQFAEGSLVWGIKESWRTYVGADFTTVEDGAEWTENGEFSFPLVSGTFDADTGTTLLTFAGSVHFQGYCTDTCLLDTRYGNFTVEIGPAGQVIRGDWTGRLREDPQSPPESATGVDLATLEVVGLAPEVTDTTTTWTAVPAIATEQFVTYAAGTRLDAATITYEGPGGAPSFDEQWDAPGAPLYEPTARWISETTESNTRIAYPTSDGSTLIVVQGASSQAGVREHRLISLDPVTLAPIGAELRIPDPGFEIMLRTAFDPASGAVFWPSTDGATVTVHRSVWDPNEAAFVTSDIGVLPTGAVHLGSPSISSYVWNPVTSELVVVSGLFSIDEASTTLTTFSAAGGTWQTASTALELPADIVAEAAGRAITMPFGLSSYMTNMAVLPDGSLVLAGGGSYSVTNADGISAPAPLPTFHIELTDDGANLSTIVGSIPADPAQPYSYGRASTLVDGSVLVSAGLGGFRTVSLVDGVAVVGDEFMLDAGGSIYTSPNAAGDAVTGLNVTTNQFAKVLVAFRDGAVVGTQALPLANGFNPMPLTVGADGALFVQIRDEAGLGGIERMELRGTVPTVTTQPASATIDLSAGESGATFSVAGDALPEVDVQWQSRASQASAFVDIAGATTPTLTVAAPEAADGTEFRAVLSSPAGSVASDVAALTVVGAIPQPLPGTPGSADPGAAGPGTLDTAGGAPSSDSRAATADSGANTASSLPVTGRGIWLAQALALALMVAGLALFGNSARVRSM